MNLNISNVSRHRRTNEHEYFQRASAQLSAFSGCASGATDARETCINFLDLQISIFLEYQVNPTFNLNLTQSVRIPVETA